MEVSLFFTSNFQYIHSVNLTIHMIEKIVWLGGDIMEKVVLLLSKGLHAIAQVILLAMTVIITFDILGRWLFNLPIKGTFDFTQIGLSMVIFLGIAYTHAVNEHITIDFIMDKFPKRVQMLFNSLVNFVITGLLGLLTWNLWGNAQRLLQSNTVTGDLGLPVYIFAIIATIGTAVFALTALLKAVLYLQKVGNKDES
ncbi:TRAP transporter small permease [Bacillus sp. B15-48]|uniref:TRAP transporter small permease n=1 Tax=Bacillus sp. B15-48 TaxID=1548601 RepID=UPI00193F2EA9|nr:TRAP transporter small permease [Bacillus sp. B15-48]MBM4763077.1 TRAP transporter small permease subunit [Bacillus sp. B15-48]